MSSDAETPNDETVTMLQCPACGRGRRHKHGLTGTAVCRGCGDRFSVVTGRLRYIGATAAIEQLVDGPVVYDDLADITWVNRSLIRRLKATGGGTGDSTAWDGRSNVRGVAYLDGDERRAVDLFIGENTEFVADCLTSDGYNNPLQENWSDMMYDLLVEQYYWRQAGDAR